MNVLLNTPKIITACLVGSLSLLAGCATTPNPELEKAQKLYDEVQADPQVMAKAPVAFVEAEESLTELKQLVDEGGDDLAIQRLSYETQLKTKIAREKANTAIASDTIAKAEAERKQVLIDARTLEADTRAKQAIEARLKAEEALREAEQSKLSMAEAQQSAAEAQAKADELARQLAELQARPTERGMVLTMGDVLFDYDKSDVKAGGMRIISKLARFLEKYPERNIQIEGHTDSTGSDAYNLRLSERRAESVKRALMYEGIKRDRMTTVGYGEQFPIASNATSSGRQQNRRVEIIISDETGAVKKRQ